MRGNRKSFRLYSLCYLLTDDPRTIREYMEEIKHICFRALDEGNRCVVVMDKVSISNPSIEHYWVKVTTETETNPRHVLTTVPSSTLNRKEALSWVDKIKSYDPRIESVGDGRVELV